MIYFAFQKTFNHFLKTSRFICFAILMSSAATGISFILSEVSGVNQRKSSLVENAQHVWVFNCVFVFRFSNVTWCRLCDCNKHPPVTTPPLRSSNAMCFPHYETTVCFLCWLSCLRLTDVRTWKSFALMIHRGSSLRERWTMRPFIITLEMFQGEHVC